MTKTKRKPVKTPKKKPGSRRTPTSTKGKTAKKSSSRKKGASGTGTATRRKTAAKKKGTAAKKKPRPRVEKKPALEDVSMDRVVIPVDRTFYPLDAIYGAAYVFLDRAYVFLEKEDANNIAVSLTSKRPADREAMMAMGGEFVNELLNQAIRANLDDSAKKIREYIVVKSHYGQPAGGMDIEGLLDQTLKEAFDEDPLDIAVPWEEKYGKEKKDEKTGDE